MPPIPKHPRLARRRAGPIGNDAEHPHLVRRADETIVESARLGLRPGLVGSLPQHGGGGLAGVARR